MHAAAGIGKTAPIAVLYSKVESEQLHCRAAAVVRLLSWPAAVGCVGAGLFDCGICADAVDGKTCARRREPLCRGRSRLCTHVCEGVCVQAGFGDGDERRVGGIFRFCVFGGKMGKGAIGKKK